MELQLCTYVFSDTYCMYAVVCRCRIQCAYIRTSNILPDMNFVNAPLHEHFRCFVYTSPCVPEDFVNDSCA